MKRNTCPLSHVVDRQKLPPLSTPEVGVEKKIDLPKIREIDAK